MLPPREGKPSRQRTSAIPKGEHDLCPVIPAHAGIQAAAVTGSRVKPGMTEKEKGATPLFAFFALGLIREKPGVASISQAH
jgi:hypothetical protein